MIERELDIKISAEIAINELAEFDLMAEYKRGKERHYPTYDEVYWRREAQDGTVYLKRMTPDGKATVITDDHGKLSVNSFDMNEWVIPVPRIGGRLRDIFKPKNWQFMRNYEYLEETSLKVGKVTVDGTKITGIEVVKNRLLAEANPKGLIGEFRDLIGKAGIVEEKQSSPKPSEHIIFGQPEEKRLDLGLIKDKVDGQSELWEDELASTPNKVEPEAQEASSQIKDTEKEHPVLGDRSVLIDGSLIMQSSENVVLSLGGPIKGPFLLEIKDGEAVHRKKTIDGLGENEAIVFGPDGVKIIKTQTGEERAILFDQEENDAESGENNDQKQITEYFERHNGNYFVMNGNEAIYRVLGRRSLARIIFNDKLTLEEKKEKIKAAYLKKKKDSDPEVENLVIVETAVKATA